MLNKREINIIKELTIADFKLRYNSSFLGFLWSFLNPLLMLIVFYIIFSVIWKNEIKYYPLFALIGIIFWNFFSESTSNGIASILNKSSLITKTYFKREIIIISSCLVSFFTLLLNLGIFIIFMIGFGGRFSWHIVFLPIILVLFFLLSLGVSFGIGAFYLKFRDLEHLWRVLLQIGFFATPIFYPSSLVPSKFFFFYMLNPVARLIVILRDTTIYNRLPSINLFITLLMVLFIFGFGYIIFKKRSKYFAEEI